MSSIDAIHGVAGRSRGPEGFVTHPPRASRCPCIDEANSRRPERCDPVLCAQLVRVAFCRAHRYDKLRELGIEAPADDEATKPRRPVVVSLRGAKHRAPWTAAADAQLLEMADEQGLTAEQIGLHIGRTRDSVVHRLSVLRRKAREAVA